MTPSTFIRSLVFIAAGVFPSDCLRRPPPLSKLAWPVDSDFVPQQDPPQRRSLSTSPIELPTAPDHLVTSLPLLPEGAFPSRHYAGHIPTTSPDRKLFYWLFEPSSDLPQETAPLLIWLNGGPGCSSMDGLFIENGPFRLVSDSSDWRIDINSHSWHNLPAWVMYLDQPVGTGLSFTTDKRYCGNDVEVNEDFYAFLLNFVKVHADVFLDKDGRMNRKLFFAGESHAGHYIPSMMDYILYRNDRQDAEIRVDLGGAAIGNGWVDPYHQYSAATAAYGSGLVDFAQWADLNRKEVECQELMDKGNLDAKVCFKLLDHIVDDSNGYRDYKVSVYDTRKWEDLNRARTFPPGHKDVEAFLGNVKENRRHIHSKPNMEDGLSEAVLEAIHATEATKAQQYYQECTDPPYQALVHQDGKGVVPELVRVLEHSSGIQVLFFNGMNDLMCNHAGNERFLDMLPWQHAKDWSLAKRFAWSGGNGGVPVGYVKTYENLSLLKVKDSGHMVPMDQPEVSMAMMRILLQGGSFEENEQKKLQKSLPGEPFECGECPECPSIQEPSTSVKESAEESLEEESSSMLEDQNKINSFQSQNDEPVRKFVIGGAWMGALVACCALFAYIRNKRRMRLAFEGVVLDEQEMEETGNGEVYRDIPEDREVI